MLKFSNATSEFAADMNNLNSAIENLEGVIREVDIAMAQARANFTGIKIYLIISNSVTSTFFTLKMISIMQEKDIASSE